PLVRYALVLELADKPWLPALDLPVEFPDSVRRRPGFVLETRRLPRPFQRFELGAYPRSQVDVLTDPERLATLQLPTSLSPRVRALAENWRNEKGNDSAIIDAALDYFRNQPFYYTLRPPVYEDDPVDEFLFDVRRGFCEHYASAFVTLMRAAGVPARIVTGYQGGEENRSENYLIVRQSDAHAWAEVWLAGRGWVRVDPTAAVAPERIDYGAEALQRLFRQGARLGRMQPGEVEAALARGWVGDVHQSLRLALDSTLTAWQRWVLNYDFSRQQELLGRLGFENIASSRLLGLLASTVALLFAIYMLVTRPQAAAPDAVQRAWLDFCGKLSRSGLVRQPNEGPLDFASRVARSRPDRASETKAIAELYSRIRYAGEHSSVLREQLQKQIKTFRA
ncbi:MAG: transglutaminase domain-containing protein, partial [Gammaproteobacteria bacterium]|nr:transglutaminase domain-containing protein [Gammaproteobacteria bacterium]